jgi:hypothetical protein
MSGVSGVDGLIEGSPPQLQRVLRHVQTDRKRLGNVGHDLDANRVGVFRRRTVQGVAVMAICRFLSALCSRYATVGQFLLVPLRLHCRPNPRALIASTASVRLPLPLNTWPVTTQPDSI